MALATNSTPGSIILGGDLTGTADAPQLRNSGVVPAAYPLADIVVDSKGRIVSAVEKAVETIAPDATTTSLGVIRLAGDLDGTSDNVELVDLTPDPAGTYVAANIDVDSKGRVTAATNLSSLPLIDATEFVKGGIQLAGDLTGVATSPEIVGTTVTPGSYLAASIDVDSKGRVTAATGYAPFSPPDATNGQYGIVQLAGDLTGTSTAPELIARNYITPNVEQVNKTVTVDAQGFITAVGTVSGTNVNNAVEDATTTTRGKIRYGGDFATSASVTAGAPVLVSNYGGISNLATQPHYVIVSDKGRLTAVVESTPAQVALDMFLDSSAVQKGALQLAGDLGGSTTTALSPQLTEIITPGTFSYATVTVDAKGRISNASSITSGQVDAAVDGATTTTAGSIQLTGALAGTASSPALTASGVTPDTYDSNVTMTVGATGLISSANESTPFSNKIQFASYSAYGKIRLPANTTRWQFDTDIGGGLTFNHSVATDTLLGTVKSSDTAHLPIAVDGTISVVNIANRLTANEWTARQDFATNPTTASGFFKPKTWFGTKPYAKITLNGNITGFEAFAGEDSLPVVGDYQERWMVINAGVFTFTVAEIGGVDVHIVNPPTNWTGNIVCKYVSYVGYLSTYYNVATFYRF